MTGALIPLNQAPVSKLIEIAEESAPFVRPRTESDYWLYGRLFSDTCKAVVDQGIVIGFIVAFRGQTNPAEIYIQDVAVASAFRRQGVGNILVQDVVRLARSWAVKRVWLTSEPENYVARHAWATMGFENLPADRQVDRVWVTTDLKGPGKDRAVYALCLD
jgi:ribosomal protein S18 acetylase RimI-like enzyme